MPLSSNYSPSEISLDVKLVVKSTDVYDNDDDDGGQNCGAGKKRFSQVFKVSRKENQWFCSSPDSDSRKRFVTLKLLARGP